MCYETGKYTVCRSVRNFLQAMAVKGLISDSSACFGCVCVPSRLKDKILCVLCELMFMYYTVCYFTGIFYAVVRHISMLFIDSKDSVFCIAPACSPPPFQYLLLRKLRFCLLCVGRSSWDELFIGAPHPTPPFP